MCLRVLWSYRSMAHSVWQVEGKKKIGTIFLVKKLSLPEARGSKRWSGEILLEYFMQLTPMCNGTNMWNRRAYFGNSYIDDIIGTYGEGREILELKMEKHKRARQLKVLQVTLRSLDMIIKSITFFYYSTSLRDAAASWCCLSLGWFACLRSF